MMMSMSSKQSVTVLLYRIPLERWTMPRPPRLFTSYWPPCDNFPRLKHLPDEVSHLLPTYCAFETTNLMWKAGEWKNHLELARDPEQKVLGIVGMLMISGLF